MVFLSSSTCIGDFSAAIIHNVQLIGSRLVNTIHKYPHGHYDFIIDNLCAAISPMHNACLVRVSVSMLANKNMIDSFKTEESTILVNITSRQVDDTLFLFGSSVFVYFGVATLTINNRRICLKLRD